jgi:murein DD-endopeptidase MepM/ murein hydrolase activator NlpD
VTPRSEGAAVYRQDELVGRSWPDVSTASRPAVGLGTPVPPLPRRERAAATSSRETGRIALEDRPRPLRSSLKRAAQAPTAVPGPRPATDDADPADLIGAALASLTRNRLAERRRDDVPASDEDIESGGVQDDHLEDDDLGNDDLESGTDEATDSEAVSRRPRRRLPAAPGRKPALLLVALVVGALLAALPGGAGTTQAATGSGSDFGLGVETDTGFAGGVDLTGARGEISQAEAEARLSEIAASRAARQPEFVLPTQGRLTTCFCMRWGSMHWGLDLAAPLGTPIHAAADGVVLRAGAASGYGKAIYIQDADGDVHVYGHMRYLYVEAGDVVSAGDLIAKVGSEGQSTGPHLHYEIHKGGMNGKPIDPEDWLGERGITV